MRLLKFLTGLVTGVVFLLAFGAFATQFPRDHARGYFSSIGGGTLDSNLDANGNLITDSGDQLDLGSACTDNHTGGANDVCVGGDLQVDSYIWADLGWYSAAHSWITDNRYIQFGLSNDAWFVWNSDGHFELWLTNADGADGNEKAFAISNGTNDTKFHGKAYSEIHTETIADNAGGGNATATLTPTTNVVYCDCDDAQGCDVTMGEGAAVLAGEVVTIIGETAVTCEFADTDGVSNLTAAFSMGDDDVLVLVYAVDEWVEVSRADN